MPSPEFLRSPLALTLGAGVGAGVALASYAAWEARQYTLREVTVPILPPGRSPLRVLHLSDIHMAPTSAPSRNGCARWPTSRPTW